MQGMPSSGGNNPYVLLENPNRPSEPTKYDDVMRQMKAESYWIYVVVERKKETSLGGIHMPVSAKDMFARVLHVGAEVTKAKVKEGDRVIFKDGISAIPLNYVMNVKDNYTFVHELNIVGKLPDDVDVPRVYESGKK